MTPTQLTLKEMRQRGYSCWIVEHWNSFARIRQDLFGIVDVLCIGHGETIAIQCTSYSNVSARVAKIADNEYVPVMRKSGWKIYAHGWRKVKNRWTVREVDCS